MSKTFQEMVTEFHEAFDYPVGEEPQMLDESRFKRSIVWMREEIKELEQADNLVDQVDALTDLAYFVIGFFVAMGVDFKLIFEIVHLANMRKVETQVRYREDGKVAKPDNWESPESEIAMALNVIIDEAKRQDNIDKALKARYRFERNIKDRLDIGHDDDIM